MIQENEIPAIHSYIHLLIPPKRVRKPNQYFAAGRIANHRQRTHFASGIGRAAGWEWTLVCGGPNWNHLGYREWQTAR